MACDHKHGQSLTWGLASGQRATVFCYICREVFLRYVTPNEARGFIDEHQATEDGNNHE